MILPARFYCADLRIFHAPIRARQRERFSLVKDSLRNITAAFAFFSGSIERRSVRSLVSRPLHSDFPMARMWTGSMKVTANRAVPCAKR
jgi:hypothetical protein